MSSLAAKLKKGTKVKITTKGDYNGQIGTVKYVGPIEQKKTEGDYVGLQLEKPIGKNNGTHNGKQYFKTKPNYGIFLKPTSLSLMDGTPVVPPSAATKTTAASNKLSKDLEQADKPEPEEQQKKEQKKQISSKAQSKVQSKVESKAESKEQQIKQVNKQTNRGTQQLRTEIDQLRKKIRGLQEQNRTLKIENEKVKYAVKEKDQGKQKQLQEQIDFFKAQKQAIQKQKSELKKKNAQLNAQLEEYADNMGMVDTLTVKIQTLQAKNQKLKQELQSANSELKNYKMAGNSQTVSQQQFNEDIKILNETITLLESDLKQITDKNTELQQQLKKRETSEGQAKKLQRKLKQKQQELQQMAGQLQLVSDAAAFAQKLTLDMLKKEEKLKETTVKLNQYLNKVQVLEGQLAINKQFQDEVNQQLFHQEELMDKYSKQIQEKNKHIGELNRQIQKYKKKIFEITQNSETASNMSASQIMDDKEDLTLSKPLFGDQYQNKYYNVLKLNHEVRKKQLKHMIQFSEIRNQVGVYMLNLSEALPESFTTKLYPEVISLLTAVKSANDKLYYIFTSAADTFKNKSDIYSKDNQQLAQWYIVLMKQVITLYGCLHKIQFSFTTAQSEQQISQILDHRILKDQVRKTNNFALEMLQKFVDDNVSSTVDLSPFITCIESLDEINLSLKKNFTTQYDTKMRLCVDSMETVTNIYEAITKFKHTNELGENAEVDNALQLFVKTVLVYVKECCMNPYIRFKSEMKEYLNGLNLISNILNDIGVQGNYHELNSLYSETENIKMLRQTLLTTQYHANALQNDLKDIVYPSQVSKIQTQLPGKFWQQRIKLIKQQLLKVKQISEEKAELQLSLVQAKKKNALLERDLKDKQSTKELYERRIGELQLKVQQATSIENQNKRQAQKIKSYEDANKTIEEEMVNLTKKNKGLQQENKKIKQKYDTLQTQTMMRNKKQNKLNTLSSQDVANLTIFKNAVKQSNQLRVFDLKKKMMELKQSPIFTSNLKKQKQPEKVTSMRSKAFDQISKFTVNDPFNIKRNPHEASLDSILLQIDKIGQNKMKNQIKNKSIIVGAISIGPLDGRMANFSDTGLSIIVK